MQIVIDISERRYKYLKKRIELDIETELDMIVAKGTPLPKGHGRLIDADAVDTRYSDPEVVEVLNGAPTIIEADKEEEDEKH